LPLSLGGEAARSAGEGSSSGTAAAQLPLSLGGDAAALEGGGASDGASQGP